MVTTTSRVKWAYELIEPCPPPLARRRSAAAAAPHDERAPATGHHRNPQATRGRTQPCSAATRGPLYIAARVRRPTSGSSGDFDILIVHAYRQQQNDDVTPGNTDSAVDFVTRMRLYRVTVTSYLATEVTARGRLTVRAAAPSTHKPTSATPTGPPVSRRRQIDGQLAQGDTACLESPTDMVTFTWPIGATAADVLAVRPYLLVRTPGPPSTTMTWPPGTDAALNSLAGGRTRSW